VSPPSTTIIIKILKISTRKGIIKISDEIEKRKTIKKKSDTKSWFC
jgi:hypothetical protein